MYFLLAFSNASSLKPGICFSYKVAILQTPVNKPWSKLLKIQSGEDPTLFKITNSMLCATPFKRKSPQQNKTTASQPTNQQKAMR